jgi:hypothetical protein
MSPAPAPPARGTLRRAPGILLLPLFAASWIAAAPAGEEGTAVPAGVGTAASPEAPPPLPGPAGVGLEVAADRTAITVGDPIAVTLKLTRPPEIAIRRFAPEAELGKLTLLDRLGDPPRTLPDGRIEEVRHLRVTVFEVGAFEIPAFVVEYTDAAGRKGKSATAAIPVQVASVLPAGDPQPADIKPPAAMPERILWPWLAGGAALLAAAAWWWWRRRRRRPVTEAAPQRPVPALPPHLQALEELERLLAGGLPDRGRLKEFHVELTEILRRYLWARFGVDTFERTTTEILEALRGARLPLRATTLAAEFFGACDLVKFAKHLPDPDAIKGTVDRAYRLIDATRPPEPSEAPAAGAALGGR